MALQTRIRLLSLTRLFVLALFIMIAAVAANVAYAGEPAQMSQTGAMWQVIMTLFGVLNTILTGVIVWLVSNQKELFQRMGKVETGKEVREKLCDERHLGRGRETR